MFLGNSFEGFLVRGIVREELLELFFYLLMLDALEEFVAIKFAKINVIREGPIIFTHLPELVDSSTHVLTLIAVQTIEIVRIFH